MAKASFLRGLLRLGLQMQGQFLARMEESADTTQRLLDVLPKGGSDFRLRLPLVTVQGLVHLRRFCGSLHSTTLPKIILGIGFIKG
jgi:hypothetical protein